MPGMKLTGCVYLAIGLAVGLLLGACRPLQGQQIATWGQATPAAALDGATIAGIEEIVQGAMTNYATPGVELCVVKDGQVVYSKGFGLADVDAARPVTPQSVLIQASVTKPLVAMAVMRLVEEGVINLDAPVTKYLPYFEMADVRYKAITVRMLLSHTAGLPAAPPTWDEPLDPAQDALAQALGYLVDKSLLFAPGTDWRYTNYGYIALGAVIAAVTGEPFESYMQRAWLVPLGMAHSTFVADEVDPAQRMAIYQSDARGEPIPAELLCDARDAPACNLWSSCEDMVQWAKLLLNGGELHGRHFLQPQSLTAMWTAQASTGARKMYGARIGVPEAEYGLGWFLGEVAGHRLAGHTGAIPGANAQLQLAPDDGLAVIAMDNWLDRSKTVAYPASSVAFDVLYLLLGVKPE